jgi:hypothetical protein
LRDAALGRAACPFILGPSAGGRLAQKVIKMTGMDVAPIVASWFLIAVLGVATVVELNGLNRERATGDT